MDQPKSRIVFRNSGQRSYYLQRRPDTPLGEAYFTLNPGMTVEALDEQEELMLASMSSELKDVAKETPALSNTLEDLKKRLADALAENTQLKAEAATLKDQTGKVKAQAEARAVKK